MSYNIRRKHRKCACEAFVIDVLLELVQVKYTVLYKILKNPTSAPGRMNVVLLHSNH